MSFFVFDLVGRQQTFLSKERAARATELVRMLAVGSVSRVLADDVAGLAEEMTAARSYPGVLYGMIIDTNGRVLAHTDPKYAGGFISDSISRSLLGADHKLQHLVASDSLIDTAAPIVTNDRIVGWARIGISDTDITESIASVAFNGMFYTILAIGTGILFASFFSAKIYTRPSPSDGYRKSSPLWRTAITRIGGPERRDRRTRPRNEQHA